jgi:hypothetical protein
MERPFTLLILLLFIVQLANGQNKQQPGSLQPPVPVAERHRNPDYAASDSKQPDDNRRRVNRPKSSGEYAVLFWPNQAAPGATAPRGMTFRMSTDGKAIIIGQQRVEINNGEPPFREPSFQMGLFGGSPMHQTSCLF